MYKDFHVYNQRNSLVIHGIQYVLKLFHGNSHCRPFSSIFVSNPKKLTFFSHDR